MISILRTILGVIVIAPVAIFCGLNVHSVSVTYSPFHDSIDLPLYAVGLALAVFGVLFGAFSTWLNAAPMRKERRSLIKRARYLQRELKRLQKDVGDIKTASVAKVEKEVPAAVPEGE